MGNGEGHVKTRLAGWPKRRIWRGLRRYTLYGPSEGVLTDNNGLRFLAERYIIERRRVVARFYIDVLWLRVSADPTGCAGRRSR